MSAMKFTNDHEWVLLEGGIATVGITNYAQEQLGDVIYVELPEISQTFAVGDNVAVVESVKAVGEIYMPIAGSIEAVNGRLEEEPELVNEDALGAGWLFKVSLGEPASTADLMNEAAYIDYVAGL
jgi:glycine cleavage system H protein